MLATVAVQEPVPLDEQTACVANDPLAAPRLTVCVRVPATASVTPRVQVTRPETVATLVELRTVPDGSTAIPTDNGVGVGVGGGVGVGVGVAEGVGVGVGVGEGFGVGVGVGSGEALGLGAGENVTTGEGLGVGIGTSGAFQAISPVRRGDATLAVLLERGVEGHDGVGLVIRRQVDRERSRHLVAAAPVPVHVEARMGGIGEPNGIDVGPGNERLPGRSPEVRRTTSARTPA